MHFQYSCRQTQDVFGGEGSEIDIIKYLFEDDNMSV